MNNLSTEKCYLQMNSFLSDGNVYYLMAIQLTFSNLLHFFSLISPILLSFFLVSSSIFNQNVKGYIYLGGVLIASLVNLFLMNMFKVRPTGDVSQTCNLFEFPFNLNEYVSPAFNSMYLAFTMSYLLLPMLFISQINYPVLISLVFIIVLDVFTKISKNCTTFSGASLGVLVGIVLGAGWFTILHSLGHSDLLFFTNEPSNNVVCSRPSKQTFKCNVYKNGELISQL